MKLARRLSVLTLSVLAFSAVAQVPPGYPSDYGTIVAAARKEGKVVIYAVTDTAAVGPLIKDFQALYPGIRVEYNDMNTNEVYNRFISEVAGGRGSADVLWSSAMDLQVKLINDGYALSYKSPEVPRLPDWAVWKNEAYGTTYEPVVFVYNKRLLAADDVPHSHADFARLLTAKPQRFKGKVTTYDPEKSGVGFLLATQDAKTSQGFWDLAKVLGESGAHFQANTGTMIERISSGENLLGYNMLGAYAYARAKKDPAIGYVYPKDYTLVLSRVMFISKSAQHPNAAMLWLDYILSRRGQTLLASKSDLFSLRSDVDGEATAAALTKSLGAALKPIPVSQSLMTYLDQSKRLEFLKQWRQTAGTRR